MAEQYKTIELFVNETTEGRESLTKVINFNGFVNIKKANLKITLHAPDGLDSGGVLPTEWRLTKSVINGKVFYPSGKTSSDNKIHDSQGAAYFQDTLRVNDTNTISIHWTAPLGAGVTSPHAAVTAVLEVIGDSVPFAEDLQFNPINTIDDISRFTKNASLPTALMIIAIVAILALVAFILVKAVPALTASNELASTIKG